MTAGWSGFSQCSWLSFATLTLAPHRRFFPVLVRILPTFLLTGCFKSIPLGGTGLEGLQSLSLAARQRAPEQIRQAASSARDGILSAGVFFLRLCSSFDEVVQNAPGIHFSKELRDAMAVSFDMPLLLGPQSALSPAAWNHMMTSARQAFGTMVKWGSSRFMHLFDDWPTDAHLQQQYEGLLRRWQQLAALRPRLWRTSRVAVQLESGGVVVVQAPSWLDGARWEARCSGLKASDSIAWGSASFCRCVF